MPLLVDDGIPSQRPGDHPANAVLVGIETAREGFSLQWHIAGRDTEISAMANLMKILAALLFAVMLAAAPGVAYARGGGHGGGGGGHGGGGHGGHGGGGHFHGGHFHGRGGFGWGWGWGWPYYYGGYDPYYYGDGCRWVRVRVWRGDHWSYRRAWRCWN